MRCASPPCETGASTPWRNRSTVFDEVSSVFLMSGGYDLMVMLKARTLKQLALFVAEKLSTIEGVMSTATHFVLKKYKTEGVIIDETAEDDRLQVSP